MLTLHPPAFIETESCDGPRYTRGQPSREQTGVTMTEIKDKYIPEFELPYRNVNRYIKEIGNNWDRLDENQRSSIKSSFKKMKLIDKVDKVEGFANENDNKDLDSSVRYVLSDRENIKKLLNIIWKPTCNQKDNYNIDEDKLKCIKDSLYSWSVDNTFVFHCNWKSGLASCVLTMLVLFIGILIGNLTS
jgi:hypothetical protein